jgi:hypothetical protein
MVVVNVRGCPERGWRRAPHPVRFIDLGPLSAVIENRNRVHGLVTVHITVELLKPDAAGEVQSKFLRAQAAWLNV